MLSVRGRLSCLCYNGQPKPWWPGLSFDSLEDWPHPGYEGSQLVAVVSTSTTSIEFNQHCWIQGRNCWFGPSTLHRKGIPKREQFVCYTWIYIYIICIYIYSKRKIEKFLKNNTALIFKFIHIYPFIKTIKLQSFNINVFSVKIFSMHFSGFISNLQDE